MWLLKSSISKTWKQNPIQFAISFQSALFSIFSSLENLFFQAEHITKFLLKTVPVTLIWTIIVTTLYLQFVWIFWNVCFLKTLLPVLAPLKLFNILFSHHNLNNYLKNWALQTVLFFTWILEISKNVFLFKIKHLSFMILNK